MSKSLSPSDSSFLPQPFFLYGTAWKEEQTSTLTFNALQAGFRGIDTANQRKHYFEKAVGEGILKAYQDLSLQRKEIWLQTKFTHQAGQDHRLPYNPKAPIQEQVWSSFHSSLEHLHTEYLDSYVLHGPSLRSGLADQDWEAWEAIESIYQQGQVKALGVSNMSAEQLELLLSHCKVQPQFIQNRCFAQLQWDIDVRKLCEKHQIIYQGFSLLTANRPVWQSQFLKNLATQYQCSPAEIIFSLALDLKMLPLTGTSNFEHMKMDLQSRSGLLTSKERDTLELIYFQ